MSQQTYGQDPAQTYPVQQPGHEQPAGGPEQFPQQKKTNTMAILGLVFAFVFTPLGIVFSAIGLSQIKKRREGGRGLALTGLILSIIFTLIGIAVFALVVVAASEAVETAAQAEAAAAIEETEAPVDADAAVGAPADTEGVLAACEVIVPALMDMDSGMVAAATPEEFAGVVAGARAIIEGAAAGTTDPVFVADVQQLSDDLQLTADAVSAGEDPTPLEGALTESAMLVGEDCANSGFAG